MLQATLLLQLLSVAVECGPDDEQQGSDVNR